MINLFSKTKKHSINGVIAIAPTTGLHFCVWGPNFIALDSTGHAVTINARWKPLKSVKFSSFEVLRIELERLDKMEVNSREKKSQIVKSTMAKK